MTQRAQKNTNYSLVVGMDIGIYGYIFEMEITAWIVNLVDCLAYVLQTWLVLYAFRVANKN